MKYWCRVRYRVSAPLKYAVRQRLPNAFRASFFLLPYLSILIYFTLFFFLSIFITLACALKPRSRHGANRCRNFSFSFMRLKRKGGSGNIEHSSSKAPQEKYKKKTCTSVSSKHEDTKQTNKNESIAPTHLFYRLLYSCFRSVRAAFAIFNSC